MDGIKMVDLHGQYLKIKSEVDKAMQGVLDTTSFIQGEEVNIFSRSLSGYLGGCNVVSCANGTDALQVAMMALDLKRGDEIILPVHTYVATAEVIALLGLVPVFVDVNAETFNIDVSQIKDKITSRTKAIVPVHLYGQCANMEVIEQIASENNVYIIEDTAQALSAEFIYSTGVRKKAGTIGTIGTTSFFPSKNLGCFGDGGAIFTNDKLIADKIKMISNHGQKVKYHHEVIGVNSRLDTLQAAILNVKLNYLDEYTRKRNEAATYYDQSLAGLGEVRIPFRSPNSTHVFHQYTLRAERRDQLKDHLQKAGIPTMIYYPVPLHFQKAYQTSNHKEGSFPVTERLSKEVISLPMHTEMTEKELNYISQSIKNFYHG